MNQTSKSKLNSRERLLAAINRKEVDHLPLYAWVFGFSPPGHLRWKKNGREVEHWYTMRLEHIHTLPEPWDISDDFKRVKTWLNLGLDDVLDVSFPWSINPEVKIRDWREENLLCRIYQTPEGEILQKVKKTEEEIPPGWVIQPDKLKTFEDFNLPRTVKFPVSIKEDLPKLKFLLCEPTKQQIGNYQERISLIKKFSSKNGVLVAGWSAFGMDGVIWLMGIEKAIITAMTEQDFFQELVEMVYNFDLMRTERMLEVGGIDIIVQRGWYSSTDFWSPKLFRQYVLPNLKKLVKLVHQKGLKFAYVMTTGVMNFIEDLCAAGVDLLYFVDPGQDRVDLNLLQEKLRGRMAVAGGVNTSITLTKGNPAEIKEAVFKFVDTLGKRGVILSPVDALFPDTPWQSVEAMINAWKEVR